MKSIAILAITAALALLVTTGTVSAHQRVTAKSVHSWTTTLLSIVSPGTGATSPRKLWPILDTATCITSAAA